MSSSVDVNVTFDDELNIGLGLPNPVTVALDSLTVGVSTLPTITISVDPLTIDPVQVGITELPPVQVGVTELPPIQVGITELPTITIAPVTIEPLTITVTPLDLSVKLTEFPSLRVHIPAHFRFGVSILGKELVSAGLRGEAQVITEPYTAGPCEQCGTGP